MAGLYRFPLWGIEEDELTDKQSKKFDLMLTKKEKMIERVLKLNKKRTLISDEFINLVEPMERVIGEGTTVSVCIKAAVVREIRYA